MRIDALSFVQLLVTNPSFDAIKPYPRRKTAKKSPAFEHFRQKIALKVPYWCRRSASMHEKQMVSLYLGQDRLFSRDWGTNQPETGLFGVAS